MDAAGTPSDGVDEILATGRSGVTTLFVSMSARHPHGADAEYLAWHTLDHRPEQYRLALLRSSVRLVSTPACRAARAASDERLGATDHVMTYFFADVAGLDGFGDLSAALRNAGRTPYVLPPVERGVYRAQEMHAAPRVKVGADVLPWWPATGAYLVVEQGGDATAIGLIDVAGVAGTWSAVAEPAAPGVSTAALGQRITYCFLDDDPVDTAARLRPVLEQRWNDTGMTPLLAAPFHTVVARDWDRYVP
ncbi:MAG: hypothetical protein ACHQIG_08795 [Acidimicrobiia bacterium]